MKTATKQGKKNYRCIFCGRECGAPQGLAAHIRSAHPGMASKVTAARVKPRQLEPAARQADLKCLHCDKRFTAPHYLAQHVKHLHAGAQTVALAQPQSVSPALLPGEAVVPTGAQAHLQTALQDLQQRQRAIEEQIAKMDALQAERQAIARQIEAVNAAIQAFQP